MLTVPLLNSDLRVQGYSCDAHTLPGVPRNYSGGAQSHISHSTTRHGRTGRIAPPVRLLGRVSCAEHRRGYGDAVDDIAFPSSDLFNPPSYPLSHTRDQNATWSARSG